MTHDSDDAERLLLWTTIRDALLCIVDAVEKYMLKPEYTSQQLRTYGKKLVALKNKETMGRS